MDTSNTPFEPVGIPEILLIVVVLGFMLAVTVLPFWFIFKKAGFQPALSLLMLIPMANLIMIFVLAFAPWPALKAKAA